MTRIVGMVHDFENRDVILVGKKESDLPDATLDDLVVALRCRLVAAVWPMVSIDPTEETGRTGRQLVRFRGGIDDTRFGRQFFDCDVVLKQYSLGMLASIQQIPSYKELCDRHIRAELVEKGCRVDRVSWQSSSKVAETLQKLQRREIQGEKSLQCRFWFYPLDNSEVTELEDLLVIPELNLGVKREVIGGASPNPSVANSVSYNEAADDFSSQFSDHLSVAEAEFVALKSMRTLYSMVAVAEGIGHLKNRPSLEHFLYEYKVQRTETPRTYDLLEILGVFHLTDGADYVMRISGGIDLKVVMAALNAGDLSPLKDVVIKSRPNPSSLYWRLPIRSWQLTTEDQQAGTRPHGRTSPRVEAAASSPDAVGCSLATQSYLLGAVVADMDQRKRFMGFPSPPPPPPPGAASPALQYMPATRPLGGVDMSVKPTPAGKLEKGLKKKILDSRPSGDDPSWTFSTPEKTQ